MKKNDYLKMLFQDNATETEPTKELHEAVLECTVEALSQTDDDFEVDGKIGLPELFAEIKSNGQKTKAQCVSPFRASELIAAKLGAKYSRPIDKLRVRFGVTGEKAKPRMSLEEFL